MALNPTKQSNINIGLPNQSEGSDSLYTAFNKIQDNFSNVFAIASPFNTFSAANVPANANVGIAISSNATTGAVSFRNTGVTSLTAVGGGVTVSATTGDIRISVTGGNGGNAGISNINIVSFSNTIVANNVPLITNGTIGLDLQTVSNVAGNYSSPVMTVDNYGRISNIANGTSGTVTSVAVTGSTANGIAIVQTGNSNVNPSFEVLNAGVIGLIAGTGIDFGGGNGRGFVTINATGGGGGGGGSVTRVGLGALPGSNNITVTSANGAANGNIYTSGTFYLDLNPNIIVANITATQNIYTTNANVSGTLLSTLANIGSLNVVSNLSVANILPPAGGAVLIAGNANVLGNLTVGGVVTGNLVGNSLTLTGNLVAGNMYANAGTVGAANVVGTLVTASQPNITSVGTLTSLGVNGTVTAVNFTANTGVFTGNGAGLTNVGGGNVSGQVANALVAGTVYANAQPNITSVGTLVSVSATGDISTNANVISGNANLGNLATANFLAGVLVTGAQPNITSVGTLSALNVTGNIVAGNVSVGTGNIVAGALNVGNVNANYVAGVLTTGAQPNITSIGTLANITVTGLGNFGNIIALDGFFNGNLTANANIVLGNLAANSFVASNISMYGGLVSIGSTANTNVFARAFLFDTYNGLSGAEFTINKTDSVSGNINSFLGLGVFDGGVESNSYIYAMNSLQIIANVANTALPVVTFKETGAVNFAPLAAAPATAEEGDVYYNTTLNRLQYYNGTVWTSI